MRGIILAGGRGTRLHPATLVVSKQLLPVYNKPMIYYPLSTLMLASIREILIISTNRDVPAIQRLLGDGSQLGLKLHYAVQERPEGIAQAYMIGADFVKGHPSALILGDNVFYGNGLTDVVMRASRNEEATIFAHPVAEPQRYGVVKFDIRWRATSIEEKPRCPKSTWAVTGLYFYDEWAPEYAAKLKPSPRGEYEITDLNNIYLARKELKVERLGRGFDWFDAGTPDALLDASEFVRSVERRMGLYIACLEEIAFRNRWISESQLAQAIVKQGDNDYSQYLNSILSRRVQ